MGLINNAFFTAASTYVYIRNGYAVDYFQSANNGSHIWRTAASGTAGNTVAFNQVMTLDASGNLGIGNTNPSAEVIPGLVIGNGTDNKGIVLFGTTTSQQNIVFTDTTAITRGIIQYDHGGDYMRFFTAGADRARIDSDGTFRVKGAGTAGSTDAFQVAGTAPADAARITSGGEFLVGVTSGSGSTIQRNTDTAAATLALVSNTATTGNQYGVYNRLVGDPNNTANYFMTCIGNAAERATIRSDGGLANYQSNNVDLSDIRTKTDINPLGSYWNKIAGLEVVTYKYKDQTHDDLNIGVIAQQVEAVAPEFVDTDGFGETPEDGVPLKTIYNKDLTFAAIKALQEAMARIETLEAKIAALEAK